MLLFFALTWWALFLPKEKCRYISTLIPYFYLQVVDFLFGFNRRVLGEQNKIKGDAIYAIKHQSTYETFWSAWEIKNSFYVIKEQLKWVPLIGMYFLRVGMIPIDRSKGRQSIEKMIRGTRERIDAGQTFVIFPEGTRKSLGDKPNYKQGVYVIYEKLGIPVVPVAVNTGLYWKKGLWNGKSGRVTLEYLPAIKPGLSKQEFLAELENKIETASNRLAKNP